MNIVMSAYRANRLIRRHLMFFIVSIKKQLPDYERIHASAAERKILNDTAQPYPDSIFSLIASADLADH